MLIDVIVPVYNGKDYLKSFFDSFAGQTDEDVRFIFVDDASTDETAALLARHVQGWGFPAKLLRRGRGGPGAARNYGMTAADAQFIAFFDIDDIPAPDYIASLKQAARTQTFDIFVFGQKRLRPGQTLPASPPGRGAFYRRTGAEQLKVMLSDPSRLGVFNVLLARDYLGRTGLRFVEGVPYYEDYEFLYRAFALTDSIVWTARALYGYVRRDGSAMARFGPARFACLFVLHALEEWFRRVKPAFAAEYKKWGVARAYWSALWQAALAAPSYSAFRRLCRRTFATVYLKRLRRYPDRRVARSSRAFIRSELAFYLAARLAGPARSRVTRCSPEQFDAVLNTRVPDPRRVLVYGMTDNPGGIESYLIGQLRRQKPGTFDFLCDFPGIAYEAELRSREAEIHFIPAKRKKLLAHWLAVGRLMRARPEYTTVYLNVLDAGCAFTALLPWLAGRRIVVHSHNGGTDKQRLHRLCRPWLALMTHGRAACSDAAALHMFGKRADQALFIPNLIDAKRFRFDPEVRARVRAELKLGPRPVLCHVGRISAQKNPLFLLDIFANARRMYPTAVLLHLGDGELAGKFEEHARRRSLDSSIVRPGTQADVAAYLQAADVFLLPSRYEGLPIALLEAQAAGLPCVVSDAVTQQALVTDHTLRMSISDSASHWAEAALGLVRTRREDTYNALVRAGFDITCCEESDRRLMRLLLSVEAGNRRGKKNG